MAQDQRIEIADPAAYEERLIELLGDRDHFDVLAETPDVLERRVRAADEDVLRARPFEGKWTPLEVVGHLADTELVFAFRTRTVFADERPRLAGMDQDRWVERLRHNERTPLNLLGEFASLRRCNLRFWRSLSGADLRREGVHDERGVTTLGRLIRLCAGHDLWHLDQFDRYAKAAGGA